MQDVYYWMQGNISTGDVVQGLYMIWNLTLIVIHIADKSPEFFQSLGIAKQALSVMDDPQDMGDQEEAKELKVHTGEIIFDNVTFHYDGEKKLFQNKHIQIRGSEKVGLVGYTQVNPLLSI
jgi:ATP-binding cassette, subfamily B, bacterial